MSCPSSANGEMAFGTIRRAISHFKPRSLDGVGLPQCDKKEIGNPAQCCHERGRKTAAYSCRSYSGEYHAQKCAQHPRAAISQTDRWGTYPLVPELLGRESYSTIPPQVRSQRSLGTGAFPCRKGDGDICTDGNRAPPGSSLYLSRKHREPKILSHGRQVRIAG